MIAHGDQAAFSAGLSSSMLFSGVVMALCIAVNLYVNTGMAEQRTHAP
jgi:DHA2 family methylenomycin A resistance protein-like MFS transporter